MTLERAPAVDRRSAADIERQLRSRLQLDQGPGDPLASALVGVLARFGEIIIQRLNQAPDKHFLAFLDQLGMTPSAPTAAQVPLTFSAVRSPAPDQRPVAVPRHTQVAAPPAPGDTQPVVFETEQGLVLSEADLARVIALDAVKDDYADCPDPTTRQLHPETPLFDTPRALEHAFFLAHSEVFGSPGLTRLRLHLEVTGGTPGLAIEWFIPGPDGNHLLTPVQDHSAQLMRSGEVWFEDLPQWPVKDLAGQPAHWLGCRLRNRPRAGQGQLCLRSVTLTAEWEQDDVVLQQLSTNRLPLDPGSEFHPFGERPRYGDAFYLNSEAFARPGSQVVVQFKLANPSDRDTARSPLPPVYAAGHPVLYWEAWDGRRWRGVHFRDKTAAMTLDGAVTLSLPDWIQPKEHNGVAGDWLRARLSAGHYGEAARVEVNAQGVLQPTDATLAPPVVADLAVKSSTVRRGLIPHAVLLRNGIEWSRSAIPCALFRSLETPQSAVYLGLCFPPGRPPSAHPLDLYLDPGEPRERAFVSNASVQRKSDLQWQYWNGRQWRHCPSRNDTDVLEQAGMVRLELGEDLARWPHCAVSDTSDLYWLRLLMDDSQGAITPPRRLLLNTVPARHVVTLKNELLGSSNAKPNQTFRCNRTPVVGQIVLEVREPDLPAATELSGLRQQLGAEAVREQRDEKGRLQGVWVRWREVPYLFASNPADRHFRLDRQRGVITFGDGKNGRVPPPGSNNICLRHYRTGGGHLGNQPAGSIAQLRSSLPFVSAVVNLEPAHGGWPREDQRALLERGARVLRHRDRAVTAQDYEDLARQASAEVARAFCYPLLDLAADPDGREQHPGKVSLIIIPRSRRAAPQPTVTLLRRVHAHVERHTHPGVGVVVLGPEYLRVSVAAELVPVWDELPEDLAGVCAGRLEAFLHPLRGGARGEGWKQGTQPQRSDVYALLESLPGVDHVRSLRITTQGTRPGLEPSGLFIVCSGRHALRLRLGD